jgi:hypothetical protein
VARLRLLTINLWGVRGDWPARRDVLREGLARLRPDLLTLQETVVRPGLDQVGELLPDRAPCRRWSV